MAHGAKYTRGAAMAMIDHYERVPERERGKERENIYPERTRLNYTIQERPIDPREAIQNAIQTTEEKTGRKVRKDANVLLDWIVTAPKELKQEDQRKFFDSVYSFFQNRYGWENALAAYVHMDEKTPHAHYPILPMVDGRLCAKKKMSRMDLITAHKDLQKWIDKRLGYHVSIVLDESDKADKELSYLKQSDYIAAKKVLADQDKEIEEKQSKIEEITASISRAEKNLSSSEARKQELTETLNNLKKKSETITPDQQAELDKLNEQYQRLNEEYQDLKTEYGDLNRERHSLSTECEFWEDLLRKQENMS